MASFHSVTGERQEGGNRLYLVPGNSCLFGQFCSIGVCLPLPFSYGHAPIPGPSGVMQRLWPPPHSRGCAHVEEKVAPALGFMATPKLSLGGGHLRSWRISLTH